MLQETYVNMSESEKTLETAADIMNAFFGILFQVYQLKTEFEHINLISNFSTPPIAGPGSATRFLLPHTRPNTHFVA